jgi:uncharacterized protein YlbG (UPF0298 family)
MEEKIDEIVYLLDPDYDSELYYDIKFILNKMSNYWIPGINTIEDFSLYLDLYFDKKLSKFVFNDLYVFDLSSSLQKVIIKKIFDLINKSYVVFGIIMIDKKNRDCTIYNSFNELQVAVSTILKFKSKKTMFYIIDNQYYSIDTPIQEEIPLEIKKEETLKEENKKEETLKEENKKEETLKEENKKEEPQNKLRITLFICKTLGPYLDIFSSKYKNYTISTWTTHDEQYLYISPAKDIIWFINRNDIDKLVNEFDKIKFRHRVKLAVFVGNNNEFVKVRDKLNHIPFKIIFQNTDNIDQELILDEYINIKNAYEKLPVEIKKELRFNELSPISLKQIPLKYKSYNIYSDRFYKEYKISTVSKTDLIWYITMDHISRLLNNINEIKFLHRVKLAVFVGTSDEIFTFNQMQHIINTPFKILDQPIDNIDQELILDEYIKIKSTQK